MHKQVEFNELVGKVLTKINISEDKDNIEFFCNDGAKYLMYHYQDCCESVNIEDICGDLEDLIGYPIVTAEKSTNNENPKEYKEGDDNFGYDTESFTWTFYKLATVKGYVTIRWYGESNGYYSEEVDFSKESEEE